MKGSLKNTWCFLDNLTRDNPEELNLVTLGGEGGHPGTEVNFLLFHQRIDVKNSNCLLLYVEKIRLGVHYLVTLEQKLGYCF